MAGGMDQVLKHQYIYVQRGEVPDSLKAGRQLGLALANAHRSRLTVLAPQRGVAAHQAELAKQRIVTERSGYIEDGGVVLAYCPRFKTMEQTHHLKDSVIVLVEWIPGEFEPWAKLVGAYNVATGEVMDAGLSEEAQKLLEGIGEEGYNGWTKPTDERMTLSYVRDLAAAGAYDRKLVLACARLSKWEESVGRLEKLLDRFEGNATQGTRRLSL